MKKIILGLILTLMFVSVCFAAGCVSDYQENTVYVPTYTPVPTPTPVLPNTFVGKWEMALSEKDSSLCMEFPDEESFIWTLKIKDADLFNKKYDDYTEGILYSNGDVVIEKGYLSKTPKANYNLMVTYVSLYDESGYLLGDAELSDVLSLGTMTYDKSTDRFTLSSDGINTVFKRIV